MSAPAAWPEVRLTYPERFKAYLEIWNHAIQMPRDQTIEIECKTAAEAMRERMLLYRARAKLRSVLPKKAGSDTEPMHSRYDELEVVVDPKTHTVIVREIQTKPVKWRMGVLPTAPDTSEGCAP